MNGHFKFDSLPADSPFSFTKEGYSQIENRRLPLDGQDLITVEMVPSGLILGKVVDGTTGRPIRAFNVQITFSPQYRPGEPSSGLPSILVDPGQAYQSDEGRFKIGELVAGMPLQVMVTAQGYERGVRERVVAASDGAARSRSSGSIRSIRPSSGLTAVDSWAPEGSRSWERSSG